MMAAPEVRDCRSGGDCECSRTASAIPEDRTIIITSDGDVRTEEMTLEAWPQPAEFITHVGNRCVHVRISAHVSRPLKRAVIQLGEG